MLPLSRALPQGRASLLPLPVRALLLLLLLGCLSLPSVRASPLPLDRASLPVRVLLLCLVLLLSGRVLALGLVLLPLQGLVVCVLRIIGGRIGIVLVAGSCGRVAGFRVVVWVGVFSGLVVCLGRGWGMLGCWVFVCWRLLCWRPRWCLRWF